MIKSRLKYTFGAKLRTVRERKRLTLKEVSRQAGVSESLVSQIERNKVSPSIETLLQIADVLDLDYEYLFSDYRQKRKIHIVRSDERQTIVRNLVTIEQLCQPGDERGAPAIESFLLKIDEGGEKGDKEYGHPGWEFGLVLKGKAQLFYGKQVYELSEGDSVSFPSDTPHVFKNSGSGSLQAIWVVSPPRQVFQG